MGEALKASIKMLGSVEIPGQLKSWRWTNQFFAPVAPSRGLAVMHSRYPKETEAALRKLGFKRVDDPETGLAGPGALLDTTAALVTPWLAVISQGREPWDVQMERYRRRNQVVKWLNGNPPNADEGDESLENITRARKVWDKTFQAEREAVAALGPNAWNEKHNPEIYKAREDIIKGIMEGDIILAQSGLYGAQPSTSTQAQAEKGTARPATQTAPAGQQKAPAVAPPKDNRNTTATPRASLDSMDDHGLRPGTPEFAAEKQRRLDEWRKVKLGIPSPNQ